MSKDVKNLGQVFTPEKIVKQMIKLRKNKGNILEPSCGEGAFSNKIKDCICIEIDKSKAPKNALNIDFFDYSVDNKFDTIIGNPPYVRYQDILDTTKEKLKKYNNIFDERSNLYLFFIYKCIQHLKENGELIFIVPRDFLKLTASIKLNNYIYENGTITDIIDLGDNIIFDKACPNCVIFRFEKNNFTRKTNKTKEFININGQLLFTQNNYNIKFSDLFFVKVGAVSGADKCFENEKAKTEFVCSSTRKDGKTKKMFYNEYNKELEKHKEKLLERKIKTFNENNWYSWGRDYYKSNEYRIYVNAKTRIEKPFFYHKCKAYDGSILAIFPKFKVNKKDINNIIKDLNNVNWNELGFICDGRYLFSQKSLENTILPETFNKYIKKLD